MRSECLDVRGQTTGILSRCRRLKGARRSRFAKGNLSIERRFRAELPTDAQSDPAWFGCDVESSDEERTRTGEKSPQRHPRRRGDTSGERFYQRLGYSAGDVLPAADVLRPRSGMTTSDGDDLLRVNCGRCGKPLIRSVEDLRDKRTIDCAECEKTLPIRERTSPSQRCRSAESMTNDRGHATANARSTVQRFTPKTTAPTRPQSSAPLRHPSPFSRAHIATAPYVPSALTTATHRSAAARFTSSSGS